MLHQMASTARETHLATQLSDGVLAGILAQQRGLQLDVCGSDSRRVAKVYGLVGGGTCGGGGGVDCVSAE